MFARRTTMGLLAVLAASGGIAACGSSNNGGSNNNGGSGSAGSGGSSAHVGGTVAGAGSTLAQPIYQTWATALKEQSGVTLNYNPIGSGGGISALQGKTVGFAASDPPLKATDLAGFHGARVLQFPVAAGAITVSYNVQGLKTGLHLTGPVIAEIFDGKITSWDDPAIKALNPGMSLPSTEIHVVTRADSSGTTDGFTTYLSDVSPTFAKDIGAGKTVKWPGAVTSAQGNGGVATAVSKENGSVGYVEQAYALVHNFTYATVKNSDGKWVAPTIPATSAAFEGIRVPANLGLLTVNSPNPAAYPIVSQTFLDTYADMCHDGGLDMAKAKGVFAFFSYAFGAGQQTFGTTSGKLPYAGLPASILTHDQEQLKKLTCNGTALS